MQGLWDWVAGLDPEQAELLTTLILIVGGALGVWLGSTLYGRRVSDLKSAVEETETTINEYRDSTEEQLGNLKKQLDTAIEQLLRARREISAVDSDDDDEYDLDKATDDLDFVAGSMSESSAPLAELPASSGHEDINSIPEGSREDFKQYWYAIRSKIWSLADHPDIHGLRRNKYKKYSNNQIGVLIDDMSNDGVISDATTEKLHEAHDLFTWHRNGRPVLAQEDVDRMMALATELGAFTR